MAAQTRLLGPERRGQGPPRLKDTRFSCTPHEEFVGRVRRTLYGLPLRRLCSRVDAIGPGAVRLRRGAANGRRGYVGLVAVDVLIPDALAVGVEPPNRLLHRFGFREALGG